MSRITDVISPKSLNPQAPQGRDSLWSYGTLSFLKLILNRNRGYFSRKLFNLTFEFIEVCFLAYYCHPDFYGALLFIPFSSFFMNLIIEELFNLNRASMFDLEVISKQANGMITTITFLIFFFLATSMAMSIIQQHWIIFSIFCCRMSLIALQSYSFGQSIELIKSRRVYFPQSTWVKGVLCALLGLLAAGVFLPTELAIITGIGFIYASRASIEIAFIKTIRNQIKWFPVKVKSSRLTFSRVLYRLIYFTLHLSCLFCLARIYSESNGNILWLNFTLLIFLYRIQNRPFRAIQIDLYRYYSKNAVDWVFLRMRQLTTLNLLLVALFICWTTFSLRPEVINFAHYIFYVNTGFFLAFSTIGKDIELLRFFIPIKLVELVLLIMVTSSKGLFFLGIIESLILLFFIYHFYISKHYFNVLIKPVKRIQNLKLKNSIISLKDHREEFALVLFRTVKRPQVSEALLHHIPFCISPHKWIIPWSTTQNFFGIWKEYPRTARSIKKLTKAELISYLTPPQMGKIQFETKEIETIEKKDFRWISSKLRQLSPEELKEIQIIEHKTENCRTFEEIKYCYHFHGKFLYPMIELGEVRKIFLLDKYDQKLIDFLKVKSWESLTTFLYSQS